MSRSAAPMKVVFDCMIFLQATANEESPAATALDLLDTGEIKLYASEPVLDSIQAKTLQLVGADRPIRALDIPFIERS